MAKIKTPGKKVMFNMSERELCKKCGYPEGFCKHTIEKEYKELCPDTPLDKESIWQLVRSLAIARTERTNMWNEKLVIEQENHRLIKENQELRLIINIWRKP